jgi:hypothetical protein
MFLHSSLCLQLQLDASSSLPPCIGPSRTSTLVKTSSKYCTIVQCLAPLRYVAQEQGESRACMQETYVTQGRGETVKERNERAVSVAAEWYAHRVPGVKIVLLTDKTPEQSTEGVHAVLPEDFVQHWLKKDALLDLVAGCALYELRFECMHSLSPWRCSS